MHYPKKNFGFFLIATFLWLPSLANKIIVSTIGDLQIAIGKAVPGDSILVSDGIYTTGTDIIIKASGTKKAPIIISALHDGAVELTGIGGFVIDTPSTYIEIRGFVFTHKSSRAKTTSGTANCRWIQNIFETADQGDYLTISGSDHEIGYNTFRNKNSMGKFLAIRGRGAQIAERLWIHHNYFVDFPDQGGANGAEAFQFGLSGFSLSSSNSIVEYNLFERCAGENELISIKASAVTLRYNTIRDCKAQFTLRHGNKNLVYGNYFFNTPGLRIFGDDHLVYSNYFERCDPAITIGNGGAEVADGAPLTSHDRPDRVLIAFNTLVNNSKNIVQTPRANGLGATYITVANNLIQGGNAAAVISGPLTNATWEGNMIFNTSGGEMPVAGFKTVTPKLARDASDIFHLQGGSPAIDAAAGQYRDISWDMDGQPRKGKLDVGADESTKETVKAVALKPADVGAGKDNSEVRK